MGATTVSFSDSPTVQFIPKRTVSMLDDMFYDAEAIANFRHEAFLEQAGLEDFVFEENCSDDEEVVAVAEEEIKTKIAPRRAVRIPKTSARGGKRRVCRELKSITAFHSTPVYKARCRGYGRPDDFLPLSPRQSPLKGGCSTSGLRIKRVIIVNPLEPCF